MGRYNVPAYDVMGIVGFTTTSNPNVVATVTGAFGGPYVLGVMHLNANFSTPMTEVGTYFGNDTTFNNMMLSVYSAGDSLLGSIIVPTNHNYSVDHFIGLRSDVPFVRARFENLDALW